MTAFIVTEWKPLDPTSPGWPQYETLQMILANDNADGIYPASMYDRNLFSSMREAFALSFVFTSAQPGMVHYTRVKGTDRIYSIMAFDTVDNAHAYQSAVAAAPHNASYESIRDQFLALVKVQMILNPVVDMGKEMTQAQIGSMTEADLLTALGKA